MKILKRQVNFYPAIIVKAEAEKYREIFDLCMNLGIIQKISNLQYRDCPTCNSEALEIQVSSKNRAYTLCTMDEYAGRDYFDPNDLEQWRFNIIQFLSLFVKAFNKNNISSITENFEGLLWNLGVCEINDIQYHCFFCRNIDEMNDAKFSILKSVSNPCIFYTGIPHQEIRSNHLLVPLENLIEDIDDNGILFNDELLEQYFPDNLYPTSPETVILDESIVLEGQNILCNPKTQYLYRKSLHLAPLQKRIIERLYQIKGNQKNALSLTELANALDSSNKSISNQIKGIETICNDNSLKQILYKYSTSTYGINPDLDCCK